MRKADVDPTGTYWVRVSGKLARCRLTKPANGGGWHAINLDTNREIRIRTAARLRKPVAPTTPPAYSEQPNDTP